MPEDRRGPVEVARTADISECGRYRYSLGRRWGDGPVGVFVMLNPSTADAYQDDPTIRRCIGFAKREGWGGIEVVNLWAWRATDPKELLFGRRAIASEVRGPLNTEAIREALSRASFAVAAWGATVDQLMRKGLPRIAVESLARDANVPLMCLGTTKDGHPRHPLYVPADAPLVPWPDNSPSLVDGGETDG